MKALQYHRYGGPEVVKLVEAARPVPRDNQVLIRVMATTITSADWRARSMITPRGFGLPARLTFGLFRPRRTVLGTELAGEVEDVGLDVTGFQPGDRVFAFDGFHMGSHAEFRCIDETGLILPAPDGLSLPEAAALSFGGTTALYFLRDRAKIAPGERVLIIGASGGVGSAAVQLAVHFGAEVTGVCSGGNADMVMGLGAERVIDYTGQDFRDENAAYDVIFDTTGTADFANCKTSLAPGGRLVLIAAGLPEMLGALWAGITRQGRVIIGVAPERREDLQFLADLAEAGAFRPVIDRVYPFEQAVEAHAYVDTGRKRGNVILTPDGAAKA